MNSFSGTFEWIPEAASTHLLPLPLPIIRRSTLVALQQISHRMEDKVPGALKERISADYLFDTAPGFPGKGIFCCFHSKHHMKSNADYRAPLLKIIQ